MPFPISFIMLKDSPIALNGSRKPSFIISKNIGRPFSVLPVSTVVPTSFACSSLSAVNLSNFKAFASILFFVSPFSLGERLSLSCKFLVSILISFSRSCIVLFFFSINFSSCLICDLVNISTSFVSLLTRATIFCCLNFCTVSSDLRACCSLSCNISAKSLLYDLKSRPNVSTMFSNFLITLPKL